MKRALAVIAALIALMLTVVACGETTAPKGGEPTAAAGGLGPTVRQALLDANGVASFNELSVSSPGFAITGIDSIGRDDVRVHVQRTLDKEGAAQVGRWVVNLSCTEQTKKLRWVTVRDASGRDFNYEKASNPTPSPCR